MKALLGKELIRERLENMPETLDAIYVLGGAQSSLALKFRTAADFYHRKTCKKILLPSRPGITEYSSLLRRNLTNDEWATRQLEKLDIPKASIELVNIGEGWFGTLAEAKDMSRIFIERGYKNVLLISSLTHTARLDLSFKSLLKESGIRVFVKGSDEAFFLREGLKEFIKLKVYQCLLPLSGGHKTLAIEEVVQRI